MNTNYFSPLLDLFEANKNDDNALKMAAYMKNKFSFYGIKSPLRKELQKQFLSDNGKLPPHTASKDIKQVWNDCNREVNYVIQDILRHKRYWDSDESIELVEWLIVNKSWWDTVDALAVNCAGQYLRIHPEKIEYYNAKWISSDNIWLVRTAILFQLKYKEKTNFELLKSNIRLHSHQKEFFIKKAIGWALREYSKTNPSAVIKFLNENELQNLSIREASKYL